MLPDAVATKIRVSSNHNALMISRSTPPPSSCHVSPLSDDRYNPFRARAYIAVGCFGSRTITVIYPDANAATFDHVSPPSCVTNIPCPPVPANIVCLSSGSTLKSDSSSSPGTRDHVVPRSSLCQIPRPSVAAYNASVSTRANTIHPPSPQTFLLVWVIMRTRVHAAVSDCPHATLRQRRHCDKAQRYHMSPHTTSAHSSDSPQARAPARARGD